VKSTFVDVAELQRGVASFVAAHGLEIPLELRLLDLVSEVGELAKEPLTATDYGQRPFEAGDDWASELGDALFSLICLANSSGVDLQAALAATLDKYAARLTRSGTAASSSLGSSCERR
jgi:NTP pyrophosphatase (non-canonical NTP hydrolase)